MIFELPDDELLDLAATGSQRAFSVLCVRKIKPLLSLALARTEETGRAMEMAALVLLNLWRDAPSRCGRKDVDIMLAADLADIAGNSQPSPGPFVPCDQEAAFLASDVMARLPVTPQRGRAAWWLARLTGSPVSASSPR
jgi:hypothetical protein